MARRSVLEELEIALGKIRRIVDEKGAYVLAVPEDKDAGTPDYVHTVGLTERELPELVLFGVPLSIGELVLERLIVRLLAGEPLPRDERLTAGAFTVVLHDVPKEVALSYIGVVHALCMH